MEPTSIAKSLLVYGPLGVICVISLYVVCKLYRDSQADRVAFSSKLELLMANHAKEISELQERYINKAETWMEKYHELVKSLDAVLQSITQRFKG